MNTINTNINSTMKTKNQTYTPGDVIRSHDFGNPGPAPENADRQCWLEGVFLHEAPGGMLIFRVVNVVGEGKSDPTNPRIGDLGRAPKLGAMYDDDRAQHPRIEVIHSSTPEEIEAFVASSPSGGGFI